MAYDVALEKALEEFKVLKPFVAAARSGTDFAHGKFKIRFFNRTFLLSHPAGEIEEVEAKGTFPAWLRIVMLHYLIQADGTPVADHWITYRELPGAVFFERRFMSMAIGPLTKGFGNDLEGFKRAGTILGGEPITRTGDAGFRFLALPRIPMACILYLGDEEVQSSVNVLFDASAPAYLPTEDLSIVGTYLNSMQKYRAK
ncbi:MAG: DUF3786 domain-containing protein [Chloroflexi bacterium]|nr:DUF3786 domain-containing protein [Chloroflexota bacterium]